MLDIKDLRSYFYTLSGMVKAVDGVSMGIDEGGTVGLVGESGSGKSTLGLSIMRLLPRTGRILSGEMMFKGEDLLELSEEEMTRIRGNKISMIFQDPVTYLNPVMRVGDQILEAILRHQPLDKKSALNRVVENLRKVNIAAPEKVSRYYPFQLSGGMCQRIIITMALACRPDLLIADEPTTALDVTIQAQILDLLTKLKEEMGMSLLLITHDLGVVSKLCDSIYIMYAGKIVEGGDIFDIYDDPLHPYTKGLLECALSIDEAKDVFPTIEGSLSNNIEDDKGCRFWPRCKMAREICRDHHPTVHEAGSEHTVSCWLYG